MSNPMLWLRKMNNHNKPDGFYGWIAPPGPNAPVWNARRMSCQIPSSKRAQIPNFRMRCILNLWTHQCRVFERTSLQRAYVIPCRKWGRPLSYGYSNCALVIAASTQCRRRAHSIGRGCRVHTCVMAIGADFKMYLLRQFCSNWVEFFYNTQETQT